MFYYIVGKKLVISSTSIPGLDEISESEASTIPGVIFALNSAGPSKSKRSFCVSHPSLLFLQSEGLELLKKSPLSGSDIPEWLREKINSREVKSVNVSFPSWQDSLNYAPPEMWRINIAGLGDVGGTLVTGLRLLGGERISSIGLYDTDDNKVNRWVFESGQIFSQFDGRKYPAVQRISDSQIFDCDMFVFCVSSGVPALGDKTADVRMAQFEGNARIIRFYAKKARECGFKGLFAVVSDPVDLLCKAAFLESNKNDDDILDFKGLAPEQIKGYGLGVMNARAAYYALRDPKTAHYTKEGRVFGPHGQGLIVADSIENYDEELSIFLTEKAQNANMEIRAAGFKPYIAPALSSGALSIISTLDGTWHYSANFLGGVYMGCKNRLTKSGTEIETLDIPTPLWKRLMETYERLEKLL